MTDTPVYTWQFAEPGDAADPVVCAVSRDQLARYAALFRPEEMGALRNDLLPVVFVRLFAPLRRHETVAKRGALYPEHPTPAVKWACKMLEPVHVDERIASVTSVHDKYVRRGRHFLEWRVKAFRENGTDVAEFSYVNLWDEGRTEDRTR